MTSTASTKSKYNLTLPDAPIPPSRVNPGTMLLYGPPKVGKTSMFASMQDDYLLLDLEKKGSEFEALQKVDVQNIYHLFELAQTISKTNKELGKKKYKYGIIDTITELENWVDLYAWEKFKKTAMGAGVATKHPEIRGIKEVPNGAGYYHLRNELLAVINGFEKLFDHLIIVGHVKDKDITDDMSGALSSIKMLAVAGKLEYIIPSQMDAVGFVYRDEGNLKIDFRSGESVIKGCRVKHLAGQVIDMENDNPWDQIFLPNEK